MKRRRWTALALAALLLVVSVPTAWAADTPEYDGWLFRMETGALNLLSETGDVEEVVPGEGLYRVESRADVPDFGVAWVEPNYYVTLLEDVPNDPYYGEQWGLEAVGASSAWTCGLTGEGIRIGVVDSGLYAEHEELVSANIEAGHNYMTDTDDTNDTFGHGTFVSGVIAAGLDNGVGISGLAPGAEIVPLKCFEGRTTTVAAVISAIWGGVDEYTCDILNLSFGMTQDSEGLQEAVEYAQAQGVLIVAAVGNAGTQAHYYPAAYPGVVGVGAVNSSLEPAAATQHNDSVTITAPGEEILGLGISNSSSYVTGSGTSYATPMVAAAAALLLEWNPELTGEEVTQLLCETATDLGDPGYDVDYGYGLLSVSGLMEAIDPEPKATLSQQGQILSIAEQLAGAESAEQIFAVFYSGSRMLTCTVVRPNHEMAGLLWLDAELPIPEGANQVKLLALDAAGLAPLCAALELDLAA